ncbi:MAG: response regulator [Myxococcota bacterium]
MTSILIVEPEPLVATDLRETLVRLGYAVSGVAPTVDAVVALPPAELPDVVLIGDPVDPVDPVAVGAELRRRVRAAVVVLTGRRDEPGPSAAIDGLGLLSRPFHPQELRSAIEVTLHAHRFGERLAERERRFATTLRSIGDGVIACDPDGRITFTNPAAERMLGRPADVILGQPVDAVFRTLDGAPHPVLVALSERRLAVPDLPAGVRGATEPLVVSVSAAPIVDDRAVMLGAVLVFRDITVAHRAQEVLRAADRMATLGTLAGGLAHEINNPLTYVLANVELLSERIAGLRDRFAEPGVIDELLSVLAEVQDGARRVQGLASRLKAFSAPDGPTGTVDVGASIDRAVRLVENDLRHRATLTVEVAPDLPRVAGASIEVVQVLVNLLHDAAGAIPDGAAARHRVELRARRIGAQVAIEVSDTGRAFTDAELAQLFGRDLVDPTFRAPGLARSRAIVLGMGGELAGRTTPGQGTTITLAFPALPASAPASPAAPVDPSPAAPTAASPSPPEPAPAPLRAKVLVIDDEALVAQSISRALAGHDLTTETDAEVALARIRAGERFEVILCDLMMPTMSGVDFYETLALEVPGQAERVAFLTGGAFSERAATFLDEVPNARLDKPYDLRKLRALVQDLARRARARPS